MPNDPTDLRVAKTREAIERAFDELILEKDADRVTVKEFAERARIHRKTFYLHFESIEALYDWRIKQIMDEYFAKHETTPQVARDLAGHAKRFFTYLAAQPEVTERLVCRPGSYDFGSRLYYDQMMRYKSLDHDPFEWLGQEKENLVLRFIRATALDFYRGWVKDGKVVPVDEAADLLALITCGGAEAIMH
ncbi:MAG: TetR/AcrR family transcriptional regulator [Eggerthellaceae bacterium]|nr:TetR/AcrR family transcriptional regulator [Eggerthellaceae bacterium]